MLFKGFKNRKGGAFGCAQSRHLHGFGGNKEAPLALVLEFSIRRLGLQAHQRPCKGKVGIPTQVFLATKPNDPEGAGDVDAPGCRKVLSG